MTPTSWQKRTGELYVIYLAIFCLSFCAISIVLEMPYLLTVAGIYICGIGVMVGTISRRQGFIEFFDNYLLLTQDDLRKESVENITDIRLNDLITLALELKLIDNAALLSEVLLERVQKLPQAD